MNPPGLEGGRPEENKSVPFLVLTGNFLRTRIKVIFRNAGFIGNDRVVFNLKGNTYRLVVAIRYEYGIVYIRFVGTHQEYDRIDAAKV